MQRRIGVIHDGRMGRDGNGSCAIVRGRRAGHWNTSMRENRLLVDARARLAKGEAAFESKEGLHELQEGLAMLEELLEDPGEAACHAIARNVGRSYLARIYARVAARVAAE